MRAYVCVCVCVCVCVMGAHRKYECELAEWSVLGEVVAFLRRQGLREAIEGINAFPPRSAFPLTSYQHPLVAEPTRSQKPMGPVGTVHTGEPPWLWGRLKEEEQRIWRGTWKISQPRPS